MQKITRNILSLFLALVSVIVLFATPVASASSGQIIKSDIGVIGEQLLNTLLSRQFESFKTGILIETDDIFIRSDSTAFYNQYLYWYTGLTKAASKYWTDYSYDIRLVSKKGNELAFSADLCYGRIVSLFRSEQYNYTYTIRLTEDNGKYYISDIDSDEMNFCSLKNLLFDTFFPERDTIVAYQKRGNVTIKDDLDEFIASHVMFMQQCTEMEKQVDPNKIVDMEAAHDAYVLSSATANSSISPIPTITRGSYSYDGERGRNYADLYYSSGSRFKTLSADCTNWVSQCVWAAYGGWATGDSAATIEANIAAKKRMQLWTNSSTMWFGHTKVGCAHNPMI